MTDLGFEIKGGADEFEAAVIAVVLDRIAAEERAAVERMVAESGRLSAWKRVIDPHGGLIPRQQVVIPD